MISQVIFEELRKPAAERNDKQIAELMGHALKARDQELKQQTLALEVDKFKTSIRTKLEAGFEALAAELQGNAKALAHYQALRKELAAA